ncbi:MAG: peptidase [Brevundimonas sp.]|uniref:peptidase n=1 Tax=Brevundimonas sp. TaxID=1871086 RepID=UPI0027255B97|nr:peptidase [Brevundimonas sp.]MDO9078552.1 peptidase [Brevundimonas sp.]MDP3079903.1 peptidase [Brevundimonas sp.]MDZ4062124.1 peptidase [Brevundimonas sp.]
MTYCVGMLVEEGLAMIADTRTNAGVDSISTYRKLHVVDRPGERVLGICTAGNLSVTQTALAMAREGVHLNVGEPAETLDTAPTLFRCAQILGHALRSVRLSIAPALEADSLNTSASMLLGGQINGGQMGLFLIYSQGNFIECGPDTPYLQIGELKYGKPILESGLAYDSSLAEALKLGLISFSTTMRSNVGVGAPFDVLTLRRDYFSGEQRRIEEDDSYFADLHLRWTQAQTAARRSMPEPPWMKRPRPSAVEG